MAWDDIQFDVRKWAVERALEIWNARQAETNTPYDANQVKEQAGILAEFVKTAL